MKVIIHYPDGSQELEYDFATIQQFPSGNIVLATADGIEYNTGLDFPTMYSMEVTTEIVDD